MITRNPFTFDRDRAHAWLTENDRAGIDEDWAAGKGTDLDWCVHTVSNLIHKFRHNVDLPFITSDIEGAEFDVEPLHDEEYFHYVVLVWLPSGVKLASSTERAEGMVVPGDYTDSPQPGIERLLHAVEDATRQANAEVNLLLDHYEPRDHGGTSTP